MGLATLEAMHMKLLRFYSAVKVGTKLSKVPRSEDTTGPNLPPVRICFRIDVSYFLGEERLRGGDTRRRGLYGHGGKGLFWRLLWLTSCTSGRLHHLL